MREKQREMEERETERDGGEGNRKSWRRGKYLCHKVYLVMVGLYAGPVLDHAHVGDQAAGKHLQSEY